MLLLCFNYRNVWIISIHTPDTINTQCLLFYYSGVQGWRRSGIWPTCPKSRIQNTTGGRYLVKNLIFCSLEATKKSSSDKKNQNRFTVRRRVPQRCRRVPQRCPVSICSVRGPRSVAPTCNSWLQAKLSKTVEQLVHSQWETYCNPLKTLCKVKI